MCLGLATFLPRPLLFRGSTIVFNSFNSLNSFNSFNSFRLRIAPLRRKRRVNFLFPKIFVVSLHRETLRYLHSVTETSFDTMQQKEQLTPLAYFEAFVSSLPMRIVRRTGTLMGEGTVRNYQLVLKRYREFLRFYQLDDSFLLFDRQFGERWEAFLLREKRYAPNTVCMTNAILKVWLSAAERDGLLADHCFRDMKSKGYAVEHVYLNDDELRRIYEIRFTDELRRTWHLGDHSHIEHTRDLFIIGAKTGLRISDLERLNTSTWNLAERTLTVNTRKTQKRVLIPLADYVIALYGKYHGHFPLPVHRSHFNRYVKKCAQMAGIDDDVWLLTRSGGEPRLVAYKKWQLVTSHTARRSFATNMYLKCHDAHLVMAFTGHATEENFMRYICVTEQENVRRAMPYV